MLDNILINSLNEDELRNYAAHERNHIELLEEENRVMGETNEILSALCNSKDALADVKERRSQSEERLRHLSNELRQKYTGDRKGER